MSLVWADSTPPEARKMEKLGLFEIAVIVLLAVLLVWAVARIFGGRR
jgi:hypothetical protein